MIDYSNSPRLVTRQLVPDDQRLVVTAELFGVQFIYLENTIYSITDKIAPDYRGAYWDFLVLSNGGFYLAPAGDQKYSVTSFNGWSGDLSAQALGITACLTSYSHLSFGGPESFARVCADHYHRLRHFMLDHAEMAAILGAID